MALPLYQTLSSQEQFERLGAAMPTGWETTTDPLARINLLNQLGVSGDQLRDVLGYSQGDVDWMQSKGLGVPAPTPAPTPAPIQQNAYQTLAQEPGFDTDAYTYEDLVSDYVAPTPTLAPTPALNQYGYSEEDWNAFSPEA